MGADWPTVVLRIVDGIDGEAVRVWRHQLCVWYLWGQFVAVSSLAILAAGSG